MSPEVLFEHGTWGPTVAGDACVLIFWPKGGNTHQSRDRNESERSMMVDIPCSVCFKANTLLVAWDHNLEMTKKDHGLKKEKVCQAS